MKTLAAFAVTCLVASLAGGARAQEEEPPTPPPAVDAPIPSASEAAPPPEPKLDLIRLNAGFKLGYVTSDGFDTYASNDALPQFSIDAVAPLVTRGRLVLGAGLGYDAGTRSGTLRGLDSSLVTHRITVPLEARYHVVPGVYAFGKVAPGAALMLGSVETGGRELSSSGWAFAADASAGASVLLGPRRSLEQRSVRVWLTPEAGYGFTSVAKLDANPSRDASEVLGADEDTRLRSLSLNGFFWRASVSVTF